MPLLDLRPLDLVEPETELDSRPDDTVTMYYCGPKFKFLLIKKINTPICYEKISLFCEN